MPEESRRLNPIMGMDDDIDSDFRPTSPKSYKSAFELEQQALRDAKEAEASRPKPPPREPKTAFELEMMGGRKAPLAVPESATHSPPEETLTEEERKEAERIRVALMQREKPSPPPSPDKPASAVKAPSSMPPAPTPPPTS